MEGLPALPAEKIARNWYHMQPQGRKDQGRNSFSDLVQGWAKVHFPGSVNMRRENCVFLHTAGRRTQIVHLIFTEPGKCTLVHPGKQTLVQDKKKDR